MTRIRVPVSNRDALKVLTAISVHAHQAAAPVDIRAMGTRHLIANRIHAKVTVIAQLRRCVPTANVLILAIRTRVPEKRLHAYLLPINLFAIVQQRLAAKDMNVM